jgi:hypothetical protein
VKAIYAGLAILLAVCALQYFPVIILVTSAYQTAKDMNANYDAMADLLQSIEYFLKRLDIYAQVSHNPVLDEMVVKITLELLSAFALVTKELKQGKLSESIDSILVDVLPYSMQCRTFWKKPFWREGRQGSTASARSTDSR